MSILPQEKIIDELRDISQCWEKRNNGNFFNPKIKATVYNKYNKWSFVHSETQYKRGGATGEETCTLCLSDYLISGQDYANELLFSISQTNLSVQEIEELTGLTQEDIKKYIQTPQNKNNTKHRAKIASLLQKKKLDPLKDLIDWDEILKDDLKLKPLFKKDRPLENKPTDIIDSWITLEVLSPQTEEKPTRKPNQDNPMISLINERLPWEKTQYIPKGKLLYYQIYLGSVDLAISSKKLLRLYGGDSEDMRTSKGRATMAIITVDSDGVPVDEPKDIALASFPWAYGRALKGKLEHLPCCSSAENILKERIRDIIVDVNDSGERQPITPEKLEYAYSFLVQNCNIPEEDVHSPEFATKRYKAPPKKKASASRASCTPALEQLFSK